MFKKNESISFNPYLFYRNIVVFTVTTRALSLTYPPELRMTLTGKRLGDASASIIMHVYMYIIIP